MPRLIIKSEGDELAVESFNLKLGINKLGRALENDIRINHPEISTTHCEIRWLNDEVIIRDLDSTNGTFVDGQRIAESHLRPGQVLRVGDVEMFLDTAQAAISVPNLKEPDRGPVPKPPPGTLPCENHPASAAAYHCPECEKDFCESCVRTLKLMQGHVHKLCPLCSAHCKPIVYSEKRKRRSLLEVVQHAFGMKDKGTTQKMEQLLSPGGRYNFIASQRKPVLQARMADDSSSLSSHEPLECPVTPDAEPWRWCPRCAHELHNEKCKLRCPRCHYFMSCSDFDQSHLITSSQGILDPALISDPTGPSFFEWSYQY